MSTEKADRPKEKTPWLRAFLMTPPVAFMHLVAAFTLSYVMIVIVGRYMEIYEEFDLPLPAASVLLLTTSDFLAGYWYLFVLPLLTLNPLFIFWLYTWRGRWTWLRDLWVAGFLFFVVFFTLFTLMLAEAPLRYEEEQPNDMPELRDRPSTVFAPTTPGTPERNASA